MQKETLGNRYRLLRTLGGGGMAKVYLARDEVLRREVAVKVLREQFAEDEEFVERFRREARSAASLHHPNIVQIYDQGQSENGAPHYMAMEYVPGGTLKDRILDLGRLKPDEAATVALRVAEALAVAHERGVVHRDIKPQNVLMEPAGQPKVADFGIARAISAATISQASHVLGTAGYMSPEQSLGERVGPESDLYSLGVVLYEMLVGALPYEADTPVAVAVKHVNEPPRSPEEVNERVPGSLAAITLKLLSKRPEDRYPDARGLAADLRRFLEGAPPVEAESAPFVATTRHARDEAPTVAATVRRPGKVGRRRNHGLARNVVAVVAGLMLLGGVLLAAVQAPWERESSTSEVVTPSSGDSESADGSADGASSEVPDVLGLSEDEARERLSDAGFAIGSEEGESSPEQEGNVIRQSVEAGEEAERGSTVVITLGSGPETVETPTLTTEIAAEARLESVGLELGALTYITNASPSGTVLSQSPSAGTEVERGTAVDLVISSGPPTQPRAPRPEPRNGNQNPNVAPDVEEEEPDPTDSGERGSGTPSDSPSESPSDSPSGGSSGGNSGSPADEIIDGVFDNVGIDE